MAYWGDTYAANWCPRPLVQPAAEDVAYFEASVSKMQAGTSAGRVDALLLGVTRSIAAMRWPVPTDLVALDWSEPVIRRLWNREGVPRVSAAVRGDWREMPLASASRNVALSDGCYHSVTSHEDGALLTEEVRRVLVPGGIFCTRTFVAPDPPERLDEMFDELHAGHTPSLHVFRWRLAAALQGRSRKGVPRHDVWQAWTRRVGDAAKLKQIYGEADRGFAILEKFRDLRGCLFYYTLAELEALCAPWFEVTDRSLPSYAGGERFPRLRLRARAAQPR